MINVVWGEYSYQSEPGEDTDEPYSWRGVETTEISDVEAVYSKGEGNPHRGMIRPGAFSCEAEPGDTVYAVIVRYSTGDTFGREEGLAICLDVFTDADKAEELAKAAREVDEFRMTVNGVEYYVSWVGYFEHLEDVVVEELVVR
ncbi:hypothetical protein SEA_BILLNYE_116 [Streptomyces phage BillNye]|uniref:Uncharacterized protein n=1 Tax=Streptomyces phage BillNye TaxID=2079426 RepID=A0A2L1IVT3_9CAUD|nr:hypothetical protein FDJ30_gp134 [Streptomyces phage BillNye]AVD99299.1 hypothetical protein SEA_BILLNYE_116 [Streptomyces phage BillNye]